MTERQKACVVVGSINMDLVVEVDRLPDAGETVLGGDLRQLPGGKGANQALNLARLGARTVIIGRVGNDAFGRDSLRALSEGGVDTSLVGIDPIGRTGTALVMVDPAGQNIIGVSAGANRGLTAGDVEGALSHVAEDAAVLLVSLEIDLATAIAAVRHAARRGWSVVLNPAPAQSLPEDLLALVDVLTPNQSEAPIVHALGVEGALRAGCACVVVTRGADGVEVHRRGSPTVSLPAVPVSVVDTTGAGDAFSAALVWGLSAGASLHDAVVLGLAAGSMTVKVAGARCDDLTAANVRSQAGLDGFRGRPDLPAAAAADGPQTVRHRCLVAKPRDRCL